MIVAALTDWLLFLHIVAAMVWVGGTLLLGALATRARRDGAAVGEFVATLRRIAPFVLAPAPVIVLGAGIWLALESDAWGFDQSWLRMGVTVFALAFLVGVAHQSRTAIAAERAARRGDRDEAVRQLTRWTWGTRVILVLLLVATWAMVFKPGL
jgi:uncharacterized membrane protein